MQGCRALIFGVSGQDGYYIEEACRRRGAEVYGYSRSTMPACDVSSFSEVEDVIRNLRPDFVFQLAADSRTSHEALFTNHEAIAGGAVNILEATYRHAPQARVLLASSGLQFVNMGQPISERAPFDAGSPYAAARIYSTYLARYYRAQLGLATYVAYLFHHESPSRTVRHTSKMIALAAARAASGKDGRLILGDLSVEKEWAFAGDIAEGMVQLTLQNNVTEAVIGTGEGHTIREWAEVCYKSVGLDWREYITTRPDYIAEYTRLISDPTTIRALGWQPGMTFDELAQVMVGEARAELAASEFTSV